MTKFKVGDRLRRVKDGRHYAPIGYEIAYDGSGYYTAVDGGKISINFDQWELVAHKFKVGDKIRRNSRHPHRCAPVGYEATVLKVDADGDIWYLDNEGDEVSSVEDNWELVPVRTETITRKTPVNGTYGRVSVHPASIWVDSIDPKDPKAAEQLRAAAKTLLELAECFE